MSKTNTTHTKKCTCKYGTDGLRYGICLRCMKIALEAFREGEERVKQQVVEDLDNKFEERCYWRYWYKEENNPSTDFAAGYERCLSDITSYLSSTKEKKALKVWDGKVGGVIDPIKLLDKK